VSIDYVLMRIRCRPIGDSASVTVWRPDVTIATVGWVWRSHKVHCVGLHQQMCMLLVGN